MKRRPPPSAPKPKTTSGTASEAKPVKSRLSESYFFNSALYYLQRYASTEANLHQVLQRKIIRARQRGEPIPADTQSWITKAVEKCLKLGYVNDRVYAESKITSMRREGRSTRFIMQNLQQKGVPRDLIAEMLEPDDDSMDKELHAAGRTIRRRNLGRADRIGNLPPDQRREAYQKDLAKLMRAGFSLATAKKALDAALDNTPDTINGDGDDIDYDDGND